jgi:hypothetical protein
LSACSEEYKFRSYGALVNLLLKLGVIRNIHGALFVKMVTYQQTMAIGQMLKNIEKDMYVGQATFDSLNMRGLLDQLED